MRDLLTTTRSRGFATIVAAAVIANGLGAADAAAAVVRSVEAVTAGAVTRVVVDVEGAFRYRTHASRESGAVFVDIEQATLSDDATRVVPVSDRRVDGVVVIDDPESRVVRVSVDLAGGHAPQLDAEIDGSRVVLSVSDAAPSRVNSKPVPASRPAAGASRSAAAHGVPRAEVPARAPARAPARPSATSAARASGAAAASGDRGARAATTKKEVTSTARAGKSAAARRAVLERPLVVLDPGHGGKDPGAQAWTGEYEKDIVLDLSERIARRLRDEDVEVVMTRSGDRYVELADRRETSRKWGADAFVSIHANASANDAARGIETYYHSRPSAAGKDARRLARLENGGRERRGKPGVASASVGRDATPVLDRHRESVRLAHLVQGELVQRLGMRYESVRDLGAKEGPFFVIGENAAPSVLVEAAFLTHREEGLRMRSEVYREQIADGVARGILSFLEEQRRSSAL